MRSTPVAEATMTMTAEEPPAEAAWFERAMRWAQLTLVDDDPRPGSGFDVDFWLDYFRRIRADATCLSAGGYMAFYPTDVPGHRRSTRLGSSDPFGALVRGARELDMVVMARIDPHAVHESVAAEHPEWLARDRTGAPRPHWSAPGLYLTCPMGPHATEFIPAVNAEILDRYDVDGIFANRWTGSVRCHCAACRSSFRRAAGARIPPDPGTSASTPPSPVELAYQAWREDRLLAIARDWDDGVRAIRPEARFVPNSGGGVLSDLDMSRLAAQTDTLFADKQARSGFAPPWTSGMHGKEFQAVMRGKPVGGIFSVGLEDAPRWKDSVQGSEEITAWVASATANGLRPWFTKFAGTVTDPRWLNPVAELFRWHADHERYLRNVAPIADVGLVVSQQTARALGASAESVVEAPILGWYRVLLESRIPFRLVHDRLLESDHLAGLKVLVLPNVVCLSDEQCEQIRSFVAGGGTLVATHETSLRDEHGRERDDFGLADLFDAHRTGPTRTDARNAYLELDPSADDPALPLLSRLPTTRIIGCTAWVPTDAAAEGPLTLIDSFPDLPMEEVYRRDPDRGPSQLILHAHRGGRVAYLPGDLDTTFHQFAARDQGRLMGNIIRWARGGAPVIEVDGPGVLEVTAWRQRASMTVFVVNQNNPSYWRGPVTEVLPTGPVSVRIPLRADVVVRDVHLLRSEASPRWTRSAQGLHVRIESVADFEVVALDL